MERRGFLKGIVASIGAGAASLVVQASPKEIAQFGIAQKMPVAFAPTHPVSGPFGMWEFPDGLIYNSKGRSIAYIKDLSITANINELTTIEVRGFLAR